VVELLRHSLDGDAYNSLDGDERRRWEKAFESGDEGAFCHLFGPEKIPEHLGEFLGYFMVRKVIAGQELLRASGTVTGKLVTWLAARGYIDRDSADHATGRAQDASRDLPVADRLGGLLHDVAERAPAIDVDALDDQDWVEDHLAISDVEPGRIWFEGGIGRSPSHARPAISHDRDGRYPVTAARTADSWHLLEVGFVLPLTRGTPAPIRRRNTQTAPDSQLATARGALLTQWLASSRSQTVISRCRQASASLRCSSRALPSPARRRAGRSAASQAGRSKRGVRDAEDGDPDDGWGIAMAPFKDRPRALRPCARSRRPIGK
jgi:hypothetical protein